MENLTQDQVYLYLAALLTLMGAISFFTGVIILIKQALNKDIQTLTEQSTLLTQKGFTEDAAGLMGNTSMLVSAVSQLVKTSAGIGIFLTIMGLVLIGISFFLINQVAW